MQQMVVLSRLIPFFEKWMNPHTGIIHKEMSLKMYTFSRQQMALDPRDVMAAGDEVYTRHSSPSTCMI